MDTRELFKKLTKGARFARPKKPTNQEPPPPIIKTDYVESKPIKLEETESTAQNEDDITLLGHITTKEHPTRTKKRKSTTTQGSTDEKKQKLLHQEEINRIRNRLNITIVGRHVPEPIQQFHELTVKPDIIENLKKCGYTEPTTIQKQATPVMLQGRQVLACAPTGSGKTAAFLVPIIHHLDAPSREGFRALILCPTRELAKQIQNECIRLSQGHGLHIRTIKNTKEAPKRVTDILVTTPNRLCYLLNQNPPSISLASVQWLIIDEADKLFESGVRSFREQLDQILKSCTHKQRKVAMFSATYTPTVAKWCCHNMRGLIRITVGHRNSATDTVDQELLFVGNETGKLLAIRDLIRKGLTPPVLVFVQSKERAQQLYSELIYDGINVDAIHADRTQSQREDTVRNFREGNVWVLICTELMARGIDFKGVNLVINYDFPTSAISYVHRVGRTGRAGRKGKAVTFFTTDDTVNLRSIAHVVRQSGCPVPDYMLTMKKRSRREIKRLKISAPAREAITTTPIYELLRRKGKRRTREPKKEQKKPRSLAE